jgi:hypothetical protein
MARQRYDVKGREPARSAAYESFPLSLTVSPVGKAAARDSSAMKAQPTSSIWFLDRMTERAAAERKSLPSNRGRCRDGLMLHLADNARRMPPLNVS